MENEVVLSEGVRLSVPLENEPTSTPLAPKVRMEKVVNVWGSVAGAGSDFFDNYRKHRNAEMLRLEKMDAAWKEQIDREEFLVSRVLRQQKLSAATEKNRLKRQRRKQKTQVAKLQKCGEGTGKKSEDGSSGEDINIKQKCKISPENAVTPESKAVSTEGKNAKKNSGVSKSVASDQTSEQNIDSGETPSPYFNKVARTQQKEHDVESDPEMLKMKANVTIQDEW